MHARENCLVDCRTLTQAVYLGLDVQCEIQAVVEQQLGDAVLIRDGRAWLLSRSATLAGAVRRAPAPRTSIWRRTSWSGRRKVIRPPARGLRRTGKCRGTGQLVAGVNTARHNAYRMMIARGFRTFRKGWPCSGQMSPATIVPTASSSTTGAEDAITPEETRETKMRMRQLAGPRWPSLRRTTPCS